MLTNMISEQKRFILPQRLKKTSFKLLYLGHGESLKIQKSMRKRILTAARLAIH